MRLDDKVHWESARERRSGRLLPLSEAKAILLTGGTGLLGSHLLHELLTRTDGAIYCLVRAEDDASARLRIRKTLEESGQWQDAWSHRLYPICGDLSLPRLGMSRHVFEELADTLDVVFHNAASLNFVSSYRVLSPINVEGTREILRLVEAGRAKSLHYASTVAVFESRHYANKEVDEDDPVEHTVDMVMGYSQTKWVAEQTVRRAGQEGLAVTVYRMPFLSGHSVSGKGNPEDFVSLMIKGFIQVGAAPDLDFTLDLAPVDYVSAAMVTLAQDSDSNRRIYHLNNPRTLEWSELLAELDEGGFPLDLVPFGEWQQRVRAACTRSRDVAIYGLLPFVLRKWSDRQLTLLELYQRRNKPRVRCQKTTRALRGSLSCPPADRQLMRTYLAEWIASGFLERVPTQKEGVQAQ